MKSYTIVLFFALKTRAMVKYCMRGLNFNVFLEIKRQSHLQVEVEWVFISQGVERHCGDVMREFWLNINAHILGEIVLQSCSGVYRPLKSLDGNVFLAK